MGKISRKGLMLLVLSISLVIGAVLAGGCVGQETQIIKDITPEEALALVQENQDNPNFVVLDLRFPESFAYKHIKGAINIEYLSQNFRDELDKDKIYLIYYSCACGNIDKKALNMMAELGFKEVYKISGGLTQQKWEGLQP